MTISLKIRRVTALAVTALALGLSAFAAVPAQAQTTASALSLPGASGFAPAATASDTSFGCGSVPAFVSSNDGAFAGQGVIIHSGPYNACTPYGEENSPADTLKVWCFVVNNNGGIWVYLNDRTTGVRGWSDANHVTWTGFIPACTTG